MNGADSGYIPTRNIVKRRKCGYCALMALNKGFDRRGRCVVRLEDFTDEEMALIAKTEASAQDVSLDAELKDWDQKSCAQ